MENKMKLYLKNGIKIILFASMLGFGKFSITKCSQISAEKRSAEANYRRKYECQKTDVIFGDNLEEIDGTEKIFEPGEHIILKTIGGKRGDVDYQIQSVEGYSILGVCNTNSKSYGAQILFVNDVEVEAKATSLNEETGTYYYQNFGSPTNLDKEEDAKTLIKK